jgi:hypothetical protein
LVAPDVSAEISRLNTVFREDLLRLGYLAASADVFKGSIEWETVDAEQRDTDVIISIPEEFPFRYPRVAPAECPGPTWHLDGDGAMCLWTRGEETSDLPWSDARTLIARAAQWLQKCANGWLDEPPDLDLERYLLSEPGLFVYQTQEVAVGRALRLERHAPGQRG